LHEIEWKNNGFLFTTPNIKEYYNCYKAAFSEKEAALRLINMKHHRKPVLRKRRSARGPRLHSVR